jgi:hypothetical protein
MATLILVALFALAVVVSAIVGLVRGLNKAVIRIMFLAVAVLLTFLLAAPITNLVVDNIRIDGLTLGEMLLQSIAGDATIGGVLETVPLLKEAILALPAFAAAILVFPVVFAVLKFVTWIAFLFAQKPLRKLIFKDNCSKEEEAAKPKKAKLIKRLGGLGVGIVTGILIFGMLTTPLMGLFGVLPSGDAMSNTLGTLVEQGVITAGDATLIREVYGVTDNGLVSFYGFFGGKAAGKAYLSSASKIQAGGHTSSVANELSSLLSAAQTAMGSGALQLLQNAEDPTALYALLADKTFVDSLMQSLFQSKLLVAAVPELLASAMEGVATSMNVPANKEAVYDNMMDNVAQAVKNSGIDFEGMKAYEDAHSIVFSFARSGGAQQPATREGIMTEAEYEAQVEELVKLAAQISSILNKAISGDNVAFTDTVADHIVNEVKAQAGENGQAALESFDASGVQSAISTVDTSAIQGDNAQQLLEQLTDKEKFETDVATVETITEAIKQTVAAAVADEDKAAETASTLANVVSNLAEVVSSATAEDGSIDVTKMDFTKLGDAITELQNSNLKGVGSSLLDVVVSGDLGGDAMVGGVLGAIKEGYENGEDIGGTISSAGALINMGSAMGGNESNPETLVNSMTSLIENLNEFTISLLPTILSDDVIASMGIPQEQAEAAYGIIETLLKELMKLKGSEDYTQEVDSILALYNVLTTGLEEFNQESVTELLGYAKKSDALFNTLMSVSDDNPFGIEYPTEADRESVAQTLREIYDMSEKTQKDKEIINALSALLGAGALNLG